MISLVFTDKTPLNSQRDWATLSNTSCTLSLTEPKEESSTHQLWIFYTNWWRFWSLLHHKLSFCASLQWKLIFCWKGQTALANLADVCTNPILHAEQGFSLFLFYQNCIFEKPPQHINFFFVFLTKAVLQSLFSEMESSVRLVLLYALKTIIKHFINLNQTKTWK